MKKKIRVVMCCSDINSIKGGMVTVMRNYLEYQGFEKSRITYVATHREGSRPAKAICFIKAYIRILFILLREKADLLHLHMSERGSFYRKACLVRLGRHFGIPVIIHHHGAEFEDFYEKLSARKKKYARNILESADCNLVLSALLKQKLLEKAPNARAEVLHNAVPAMDHPVDPGSGDRIIMLGCQGKRKGSYDLLDALAAIGQRLPPKITVWMCGDGDVDGVRAYSEKLGLSERVAHVGWIEGEEKDKCLERAMMHVLPSYREGLPMSVLETMGRGIPNICTAVASVPEVIRDGENGFLIRPGDVKLLGQRILEITENKELRGRLGQEGYRTVKRSFSMDACAMRLEGIYGDIINTKHPEAKEGHRKKKKRKVTEKWKKALHVFAGIFVLCILTGVAIAGFNRVGNQKFRETFYQIGSGKISTDVRIIQISDLHSSSFGEDNQELVTRIRELEPDLIAMTGDMIEEKSGDAAVTLKLCGQLRKIAPVCFTYGNHETMAAFDYNDMSLEEIDALLGCDENSRGPEGFWELEDGLKSKLEELGIHVLWNQPVTLTAGGNQIDIYGVLTCHPYAFWQYTGESYQQFRYGDQDHFKLMLCHEPYIYETWTGDSWADLSLSGHTHGGGVRIPYIGGVFEYRYGFLPEFGRKKHLVSGRYDVEGCPLIISNGISKNDWFRINNPPELVVIDVNRY